MSKINSKRKGASGEREFANFCKEYGYDVRRTAQYNGKELDSKADVVGIMGLHIEVKRVEQLNIHKAMEQAERDNKGEEIPVVAHRKNRTNWLITLKATDFLKIYNSHLEKGAN